jgi:hypothetical protein
MVLVDYLVIFLHFRILLTDVHVTYVYRTVRFRLEFIVHLKETLSLLCVSGMWSSKGKTTEAQLKTKV